EEHSVAIKQLTQRVEEHSVAIKQLTQRVEKHSVTIEQLAQSVKKLENTVNAIGSRWGILAESAFREGLKGLFEEGFGVEVKEWIKEDKKGIVFGFSSMVQVDVAIKNEEHLLLEIKSSVSRADVIELNNIGIFYEKEENVKPKLIIVTPFIEERAKSIASHLNIKVYTSLS
ncbi:MAG TPA: DUF3782 domain-containing protein, partial [Methanosarcinales archaeon]|nr:DUF3782 domain-containing protein [Methanosarcinales archaeon]